MNRVEVSNGISSLADNRPCNLHVRTAGYRGEIEVQVKFTSSLGSVGGRLELGR